MTIGTGVGAAETPPITAGTPVRGKRARRLRIPRSRKVLIGLGLLTLFVLLAVIGPLVAPYDPSAISAAFEAAHRRLYGFATDEGWELEAVRVTVFAGANRPIGPVPRATALRSCKASRRAQCWFEAGGPATTSFYDREALIPDERIAGPAIIEDPWSTVVVPPGAAVWADGHANLQITAIETAR